MFRVLLLFMKSNKSFIISLFTVVVPIIFQLLYVRTVSYSVDSNIFGDFVILSSLIYGLSQIFLSIPGQAFSRFYNTVKDKIYFVNEFRTYLIFVNAFTILMVLVFYLFYRDRFQLDTYLYVYVLFVFFNNYTFNQKIFLFSLERKKYFILKVLESLAKFIFPLVTYYYYGTLNSFILGILLGYAIALVYLIFSMKNYPFKIEFNRENQKKYLLYSYPILISSIFSWSISFSDRYFIDYYLTTNDVAIYSILVQLGGFAQVLGMIYGIYVNPIILREHEKNNEIGFKLLNEYLFKFFLILLGVAIFIFFIPTQLYTLIIEESVISDKTYYYSLIVVMVGVILTVFQTALSMYFVLLKKLNVHAKMFAVASIFNFALNFFIPTYGIIAAAFSTFIAYLSLNVFILFWVVRQPKVITSELR